jgi:hypothetical protein
MLTTAALAFSANCEKLAGTIKGASVLAAMTGKAIRPAKVIASIACLIYPMVSLLVFDGLIYFFLSGFIIIQKHDF